MYRVQVLMMIFLHTFFLNRPKKNDHFVCGVCLRKKNVNVFVRIILWNENYQIFWIHYHIMKTKQIKKRAD